MALYTLARICNPCYHTKAEIVTNGQRNQREINPRQQERERALTHFLCYIQWLLNKIIIISNQIYKSINPHNNQHKSNLQIFKFINRKSLNCKIVNSFFHNLLLPHGGWGALFFLGVPLTGRAFGTNTALSPITSNMRCKCASIPHASQLRAAARCINIIMSVSIYANQLFISTLLQPLPIPDSYRDGINKGVGGRMVRAG